MTRQLVHFAAIVLLTGSLARAQVLVHEDFNDNAAGWILEGQWQIGPAAGSSCIGSSGQPIVEDPTFDGDGKVGGGLAGFAIGGCVPPGALPTAYLTSPAVDATGATNLRLQFDRHLYCWHSGYCYAVVDVWNGTNWVNVFENYYTIGDTWWQAQSYDITPHANAALRVRFGFGQPLPNSYGPVPSWSVDNVRITNGEYFAERFRDNSAGWTLGPEWAIGNATAGGGGPACGDAGDPGIDGDGTPAGGIAGAVIGGNVSPALHPYYWLTSPPIDTTGSSHLSLRYDRWLNSEWAPLMRAAVQVWNGSAWNDIFVTGGCTSESAWSTMVHDVSAFSNPALRVRFGYELDNSTFLYPHPMSGWNVDNVSIYDPTGVCRLSLGAHNGPGSVRISAHCMSPSLPPGTQLFNCFTLNGGNFPNGYFFGIAASFAAEVVPQYTSGVLPFVGLTDADGDVLWELPGGVPAGITVWGVMIAFGPGGYPAATSPPIAFTTT
jgi:hypothetical protein